MITPHMFSQVGTNTPLNIGSFFLPLPSAFPLPSGEPRLMLDCIGVTPTVGARSRRELRREAELPLASTRSRIDGVGVLSAAALMRAGGGRPRTGGCKCSARLAQTLPSRGGAATWSGNIAGGI